MDPNENEQLPPGPRPPPPGPRPPPPDLLVISTRDLQNEYMRQFAMQQTVRQILYRINGVRPPRAPLNVPRPRGPSP